MELQVIVLDFDGVIVESNNIKHHAFSELFSTFPEHYDEIMLYHFAHNAVNRHDKFRYIMENILKTEYDRNIAEKWAQKFSKLTRDKIINCPYVEGAMEFVEFFSGDYPIYLASATPLDELRRILKKKGILHYFKEVYGAPTKKIEIFTNIIKNEGVSPEDVLYIGDSYEDYETAHYIGCVFIARISDYKFKGLNIKSFNNMFEIKNHILNYITGG
jgi:phosphoglycolate phosphatase-like HAD superfamily hydrolase